MSREFGKQIIPSLTQEWRALRTIQKLEAWSNYTPSQKAQLWEMFPHQNSQPRSIKSLPGVGWKTLWTALPEEERREAWVTFTEDEKNMLWDRQRNLQQISNAMTNSQALKANLDSQDSHTFEAPQDRQKVTIVKQNHNLKLLKQSKVLIKVSSLIRNYKSVKYLNPELPLLFPKMLQEVCQQEILHSDQYRCRMAKPVRLTKLCLQFNLFRP
jgi:predicted Fe-S protein YdhL (DUF1289 family)